MSDRGEYRSFYVVLPHDPDFQELSGDAVKLLLILKLTLPAIGAGVVYPSTLCDQMHCDRERLEAVMLELERPQPTSGHGWIRRERNLVWIVNGLRFEPNMSPANRAKHVPYVRRLAAALDERLALTRDFHAHYPEWFRDPIGTEAIGSALGTDRVSEHKTRPDITKPPKTKQTKTTAGRRDKNGSNGKHPAWWGQFDAAWQERCGGSLPSRAEADLARAIATLGGGVAETLARWEYYLLLTDPRYCSASRFAATLGEYADSTASRPR